MVLLEPLLLTALEILLLLMWLVRLQAALVLLVLLMWLVRLQAMLMLLVLLSTAYLHLSK